MARQGLYLNTTAPSAYLDARAPDRQQLTRRFWAERLSEYEPVVSLVTIREIDDTPDPTRRDALRELVAPFDVLAVDEEADVLAQEYIRRGVFTDRSEPDALHVAVAVVNGIPYFASWNFRHLVRVATRREVNLINALGGYGGIEIVAPAEL